jgi:hypothetical protein
LRSRTPEDAVTRQSTPSVPALFAGLCDDAALFPPGEAPVDSAVPAHRAHRAAWYAPLVGPFLTGAGAVDAVGAAAAAGSPDSGPLDVVLVVRSGPAALAPALAALRQWPALRLTGAELGPGPDGTPAEAAAACLAALDAGLPDGAAGVVEVRRGPGLDAALDAIAASPYRAKYRTGGLEAAAFPAPEELAAFLTGCARRGLPFKCTAGLHRAVRHTDPATGFTHHGYLNILAATHAAAEGAAAGRTDGSGEAAALLRCTDREHLTAYVRGMTGRHIAAARGLFTAYGTCSIAEPLEDLTALGLLAAPAPPPHPAPPAAAAPAPHSRG